MESEEEERFCNNCKRYVAAANFPVHSAFCERNIFVCTKCEEPVKISEKDQHLEEYHVMSVCNLCGAQLEKWLLPNHMEEVCTKRLVECKYCESSLPVEEFAEHVEFCGSRTEKCLLCQKYIMIKDKSKHDEIHRLENQYRTKSIEDEIKQNKVNEVISKKNTTEKICEKPPEAIQSMPSGISEEEEIRVSDKFKNKKYKEEHSLEIPAHERGAASLTGREISKHFTQCHICKQNIPWIDFNTHVPACASIAGKCSLCGEHVPSYEIKEHMKSHFQGKVNTSFNVPENESSNETTYMSNQSNSAKSKAYSSGMKCPYCSEVCSEDQVLEHTRSCRKNVSECPLCGEKVPEKDKKHHEEFQCRMMQDNTESNTSDFSKHSQSNSECPFCYKLIPEENYDAHVTLQCEKLFQVGDTHALYAAGEDLYECIYCSEKMPQKEKTKHHSFLCKVLIESSGISISDSYADVTKKTNYNSYKNDGQPVSCPTCKNTFPKERILHHKSKCSRIKEPCPFCNEMIDVACKDIHVQYCPGIDNRDHTHHKKVAHDSRSSNYMHKGAIPKNTSIRDMMKPRSAKCAYCNTSYNVDILPNHEKECIHMPTQCHSCDQKILLKDLNTHKCKRRKSKFQNRQQSTSKESNEGSIWTRTYKKMFGMSNEKEGARNTDSSHNKHHWESQAYVPDNFERKEKLYFEQVDDPPLPCEFCQQEFPASQLVLHMTGCQPDLVSYAKPDSSEKLDSKQDSGEKVSVAAFKSQNIHSAFGINNPFFAKNNSISTHDASEVIEHNRKSKADELSQSFYDKKSNHENSKNGNDVEKNFLNFQSVWNVTNTHNFRNDHLKEIIDDSDKETEETTNLNEKQKGKGLDQQTSEKHIIRSPSDNEMSAVLTFLDGEKSESEEEYLSFSDENVEQTNSEMKANSSLNPQNIQEKQEESPLLKKMTNEEKSKEVSQDILKIERNIEEHLRQLRTGFRFGADKTTLPFEDNGHCDTQKIMHKYEEISQDILKIERNLKEHLRQSSAGFGFGADKTTLPFEDNGHCDTQSEKKCEDLDEPSRFSRRSQNQKDYIRYSENLSDLKLGRYQSAAFSGDANINEMIDKEPDTFLVKKDTKFNGSINDQKNYTSNSKLQSNFNFYFNNGTDISTVLFNELEHPKVLPKERNKKPNELYSQNNSRFSDAVKEDSEYIRNYRQHLPDFKYGVETIRKYYEDNVTNVTLPENRSDYNFNRAFTLEPAGSPMESKLPLHTGLKTGVKEVGLEEKIAAFELNKKILSSGANNNNVNDVKKWSGWRKKKDDFDVSDSD